MQRQLTAREVHSLELADDEVLLVTVSGGRLTKETMQRLTEFLEACRRGEEPEDLLLERDIEFKKVKIATEERAMTKEQLAFHLQSIRKNLAPGAPSHEEMAEAKMSYADRQELLQRVHLDERQIAQLEALDLALELVEKYYKA